MIGYKQLPASPASLIGWLSVSLSVSQSVSQSVWLTGWLAGWVAGWVDGAHWLAG